VLATYSIPPECIYAVYLYISDPNLKDAEYYELIPPPIYFLNAVADYAGPKMEEFLYDPGERPAHAFIEHRLKVINKDTGKYSHNDIVELTKKIFGGYTALFVSPFIKKQELHDFIDKYWNELEPLINTPFSEEGLGVYTKEQIVAMQTDLANKVYPSKTTSSWERDNLIMDLTSQGLNDTQIAVKLGALGYGLLTTTNISQIRYRQRNRKDVT
jgi:hypothetical protein